MKALRFLVVSSSLLLTCFGVLAFRFVGNNTELISLTFGWPLDRCAVEISGVARGGLAFAAFICTLLSAVLVFICILYSIVSWEVMAKRNSDRPAGSQ